MVDCLLYKNTVHCICWQHVNTSQVTPQPLVLLEFWDHWDIVAIFQEHIIDGLEFDVLSSISSIHDDTTFWLKIWELTQAYQYHRTKICVNSISLPIDCHCVQYHQCICFLLCIRNAQHVCEEKTPFCMVLAVCTVFCARYSTRLALISLVLRNDLKSSMCVCVWYH